MEPYLKLQLLHKLKDEFNDIGRLNQDLLIILQEILCKTTDIQRFCYPGNLNEISGETTTINLISLDEYNQDYKSTWNDLNSIYHKSLCGNLTPNPINRDTPLMPPTTERFLVVVRCHGAVPFSNGTYGLDIYYNLKSVHGLEFDEILPAVVYKTCDTPILKNATNQCNYCYSFYTNILLHVYLHSQLKETHLIMLVYQLH